jgi:ParB-like chromosome segregation protein Spo0J
MSDSLQEATSVEEEKSKAELFAALAENRDRKNQSPIDDAKFMQKLKNEMGLTIQQIAEAMYGDEAKKKNKDQLVYQRLSLLRLTDEEQDRVHAGKLGVVAAIELIKKRELGKAAPGETAKDKPGVGERVKMPSVAQAKALLGAVSPADLPDEIRARFGKPKVFALTREPDVREFMSLCCGVPYESVVEMAARKRKEAAARPGAVAKNSMN